MTVDPSPRVKVSQDGKARYTGDAPYPMYHCMGALLPRAGLATLQEAGP